MRFLDILMLMGVVAVLYWFSRKGKKRATQTEETAFTPSNKIDVTSSSLFHFPQAPIGAKPYYIVIDTETVDWNPSVEEVGGEEAPLGTIVPSYLSPIVQLSWTLLDERAEVIREESYILKQAVSISPIAEQIHGISNEMMCQKGIPPKEVYQRFLHDLSLCPTLVAHNLDFHLSALQQDFVANDVIAPDWKAYNLFCTMLQGANFLKNQYALTNNTILKLGELYGMLYFGRRDLVMTCKEKSRRDILLVIACLRFFL